MKVAALILLVGCDRFLQLEPVRAYHDAPASEPDAPPDVPVDAVPAMYVQHAENGSSNASSTSVTLQALPDPSHVLIAIGGCTNGVPATGGVSGAATWTRVDYSNTSPTEYMYLGIPNGTGKTVTLTTNSGEVFLAVTEWSGIDQNPSNAVDTFDQSGSNTGTGGTIDLRITTSSSRDLVVFTVAAFDPVPTPAGTWLGLPVANGGTVGQYGWYGLAWGGGPVEAKTMHLADYDSVLAAFRTTP